jgi:solute carrier family 25 protein 39/40
MAAQGQRHDRFAGSDPDDNGQHVSVSLTQKMLSAVSGSVITSLLGESRDVTIVRTLLTRAVTPLDVVRVRLQAQLPPPPIPKQTMRGSIATPYSLSKLPPNLGISACCREVFWVSNNTPYCYATPEITSAAAARTMGASPARECAAEEVQQRTFTSTIDGLRKIARNEGPRTLWRGLSPTLAMAVPANVIYFAGYDWLRYSPTSPFRTSWIPETYAPLIAGSSARVIAAVAVSPIEMFRTRMQAAGPSERGVKARSNFVETFQGLRDMVGVKGYRSLWTGLSLTLWRDVPFSAIYWWGYEAGRAGLRRARQRRFETEGGGREGPAKPKETHTTTLVDSFAAGAASGAFAALVTTPFDVGKTRQQVVVYSPALSTATATAASGAVRPEELSMPRFLWHIFQTQGASGLFRGWTARCLKVAPACAIMISSYEIGKRMAVG